jgi:hypothetical protein
LEKQEDMAGLVVEPIPHGLSRVRDRFGLAAQVAMAVVGLVLLIASVNVANLLLSRGISRRRELTVRMALGAGRWRLIRQMLAEAVLLGSAGAIAGLVAANWTTKSLTAALSTKQLPVQLDATLDARVFAFAGVVLAITVLLCGLIPAISATRADLTSDLKVSSAKVAHPASRTRVGNLLLGAQIAIFAIVLVAAGLLLHSLFNLETYNLGFGADHVVAVTLSGKAANPAFYEQLSDRAMHPHQGTALFRGKEPGHRRRESPGRRWGSLAWSRTPFTSASARSRRTSFTCPTVEPLFAPTWCWARVV